MKTIIVDYARVCPTVLSVNIETKFHCMTYYRDLDADYFELTICGCEDMAGLERYVAEFV